MDIIWIIFAVFLFILCAVLLVIEIFIPSFGLITILALSCLAGGLYLFFEISTTAGWTGSVIAFVLIPIIWIIVYRIFPKTSLGKILELKKVNRTLGDAIPDQDQLQSYLGQKGIVVNPLRPVGMCDFDGQHVVCIAETGFVEKDKDVKVILVEGNKIVVRVCE